MQDRRNHDQMGELADLLDSLPPLQADQAKVAALTALLAAESPSQPAPAPDSDFPLFLALCAGFAVVAILIYLSVITESIPLAPWMAPAGGFVGVASLVVLGSIVVQQRIAAER